MDQKLLAISVYACVLGGCATTNDSTARDQPRDEGVVLTGSRIPQKSSTGSAPVGQKSREEWEAETRGRQVNPQGR